MSIPVNEVPAQLEKLAGNAVGPSSISIVTGVGLLVQGGTLESVTI